MSGIALGVLFAAFATHVDVALGPKDPTAFERLQKAADDCRETGRDLWCRLSDGLAKDDARRLAEVALAYGAERISPQPEDSTLSRRVADFRRCDTHLVGFDGLGAKTFDNGFFTSVRTDEAGPLVIGEMVTRDESTGERAIYVCSVAEAGSDKTLTLRFRSLLPEVSALGADGRIALEQGSNYTYCLRFPADGAVLVTAKDFGDHSACPEYVVKVGQLNKEHRDEAHIRDMAAAGVDMIGDYFDNDRPAFDLFGKYGIRVIDYSAMPYLWGGHTNKNGKFAQLWPRPKYEAYVREHFEGHPALWAVSPADEPSSLDYACLADGLRIAWEKNPSIRMHLNLHPCTQFRRELYFGVSNYVAYIDALVKTVPIDHIAFDVYPYSRGGNGGAFARYFENWRIVADACRRSGRMPWGTGQINNNKPTLPITENMLRYQSFGAMAFGTEMQEWCCWSARWWELNILDTNGVKTVQYDRFCRVTRELKTLAKEYIRFRTVSTHFTGFDKGEVAQYLEPHPALLIPKLNFDEPGGVNLGFFDGVKATDGEALVVSLLAPRKSARGSRAMLCFAAEDAMDRNEKAREVVFTTELANVRAFGGEGPVSVTRRDDGSYAFPIRSSRAVLVVADELTEGRSPSLLP